MKRISALFCATVLLTAPDVSSAANIEVGKAIFRLLLQAGITDNHYRGDSETGRKICETYHGSNCYSVSSLPEGICKAANGSGCYSVTTIGKALCKAGDGGSCYSVSSIGECFCKMMHASGCYSVSPLRKGSARGLAGPAAGVLICRD